MPSVINAVELTRNLIQFNTINPPGNERACARFIGEMLAEAGFNVAYYEFAEARTTLVATYLGRRDGKPLCFTGHLDVVPLGKNQWSVEPFAGEISNGKLFGRGASDTKSGVAAFVAAVLEAKQALSEGPGVILVITAGEETGSAGAFHVARLGREAIGEAGAVIVAEPTGNYPMIGHRGVLWLKASTKGVTAHASMPEKGVNAIYKMARIVSRLEGFQFAVKAHEVMGSCTINVGTINGGININSVPDYAEIGIDVRTVPGADHGSLRHTLTEQLKPELDALETLVDLGCIWTEPTHPWVEDVFALMGDILGQAIKPAAAPYFTDAAALTPAYGNVPTIILGPGETEMAHQTDEFCYVSKIEQAVQAYIAIIRNWNSHRY